MSILYALIARASDVVLCEHTEYAGNFQQISRVLLRKIKKNSKFSIEYDKFKFNYINENDISYLCMTEGAPDQLAFAYLSDIRKKFIQTYDYDKIAGFYAYQLNEFSDVLKQLMTYYNSNPSFTKAGEIIKDLQDAKNVMVENIEKLLDRDERLNIIAMKSNNLNQHSKNINYMSAKIKKQEKMKQMKTMLMMGGAAVIIILILLILVY